MPAEWLLMNKQFVATARDHVGSLHPHLCITTLCDLVTPAIARWRRLGSIVSGVPLLSTSLEVSSNPLRQIGGRERSTDRG